MTKATRYVYSAAVIALTAVVLWSVPHLPDSFVLILQKTTGFLVVSASKLIGLSAEYDPATQLFSVAGFKMLLGPECVALHYWAILTLTIIFFPGQSCLRRVVGWLATSSGLVFFNIIRLIVLGLVGAYAPEYFSATHDYIWQVAFALLTVLLCFSWIETDGPKNLTLLKVIMGGFLFSALIAVLMETFKYYYLSCWAWLSDKGLVLMYEQLPWDTRKWTALNKSFVVLRMKSELFEFVVPGQQYTVNMWMDALGLALFLGGCASICFWALAQKSKKISLLRFGSMTIIGCLLLFLMQVLSLVILGQLLGFEHGIALARNFLWFLRSLSVLLPLLLLWWVWNGFKRKTLSQELAR